MNLPVQIFKLPLALLPVLAFVGCGLGPNLSSSLESDEMQSIWHLLRRTSKASILTTTITKIQTTTTAHPTIILRAWATSTNTEASDWGHILTHLGETTTGTGTTTGTETTTGSETISDTETTTGSETTTGTTTDTEITTDTETTTDLVEVITGREPILAEKHTTRARYSWVPELPYSQVL